jgi:alkylation response protein AidB-like acyl-CoA dehydrogenase
MGAGQITGEPKMTIHKPTASFVDAAKQVAGKLAESANARDKKGRAPVAEIALLKKSGLLKLLIPVEDGGLGGRWTDALNVTRTIAAGDGSIGQLIGYHYVNSQTPELAGTEEQGVAIAGRSRGTIGSWPTRSIRSIRD